MISTLKQKAKTLLKNLSGKYALFALPIIFSLVSTSITFRNNIAAEFDAYGAQTNLSVTIFPALVTFLLSFFTVSTLYIILEVIRKERQQVSFNDVAYSFSGTIFGKLFLTLLIRTLLVTLWSIPFAIGSGLIAAGIIFLWDPEFTATPGALLLIIGILIAVLGFVFMIYKKLQYGQAEFILYDHLKENRYQGPLATIKESKSLMKGHVWELFRLYFSFIGWYLLLLPTLGLIQIYLMPYMVTTRAYYYQYLLQENDHLPKLSENSHSSAIETY